MTRNEAYWERRAAQRMFELLQSAEDAADIISKVYLKASRYLSFQMQGVFERFMTKHKLTEPEARRLLGMVQDKASLKALIRQLKNSDMAKEKAELIRELEAPAYQSRIERMQQLQNQIDLTMQQVYEQEKQVSTAFYMDLANEAYYRSMFDIQQRSGIGYSFAHIDPKQIDRVVGSKWSGRNYSKRIWGNTKALAQDLKEELLIDLLTGRTEFEVSKILANKFAQGASNARRLVRTESCYLSNQMEMESYKESGIEKYRFVATLDLRTSKICASLDGQLFLVSEQLPGKNCPPMHPWCRSTTIAYISDEDFARMQRRARDPETGKTYLVPATMNYQEWYKKYVEKVPGSDTIEPVNTKEAADVHTVGKIDREIYKCITDDIVTDEVIITDNQIQHIKDRHPNDYERFAGYFSDIVQNPDYIIEANKPKTALVLKEIKMGQEIFKTVVRLVTSDDNPLYKNSIITFMKIDKKEWDRLLRNKNILYSKE